MLVDSVLPLSSPAWFNDPFDMHARIVVDGTHEERRRRYTEIAEAQTPPLGWKRREEAIQTLMSRSEGELRQRAQESYSNAAKEFGVCCFVGDRARDVLMWSHYADNHKGVCLQFDYARDVPVFARAVSIDYIDDYPTINWIHNFQRSIGKAILRKHTRWAYENEFRISEPWQAGKYIGFRPEALTGLIFGCRADGDVEKVVDGLLKQRAAAGLPDVRLFRAKQNDKKYELDIWSR
jgi:hypothetical protein